MALGFSINFRPLAPMGYTARAVSGWLDGPAMSVETLSIPTRAGVLINPSMVGQPRELSITLTALCASLLDRGAMLTTLTQLTQGVFWLQTPDRPTQAIRCRVRTRTVNAIADSAAFVLAPLAITLKLLAVDGVSIDTTARIESLSATGTPCVVGTGTSAPLVVLHGAWSTAASRTLNYRSPTGAMLSSLTLTAPAGASLASGDTLEVDMGAQTITKVTSAGVRSNALQWLMTGDFFVLDPSDDLTNAPPSLAVSAGAAEAVYLNTWAL